MQMKYRRCEQKRHDCFGCHQGRCLVLNDTHFVKLNGKQYKCPFYKPRNSAPITTAQLLAEESRIDDDDED